MVKDGNANEYEKIEFFKDCSFRRNKLKYFKNQNTEVNLIKNITIFYI